jgi:hypothetical protein
MIIYENKIINKNNNLIYDDINITNNIENILLIEEKIGFDNYNKYFQRSNDKTYPIVYFYSASRDNLLNLLKIKFTKIKRLSILTLFSEKYIVKKFLNDELLFTKDDLIDNPINYSTNVQFILDIIKNFSIEYFDFLGCTTLLYDDYKLFYSLLIKETNIKVTASDNHTKKYKYFKDNTIDSKFINIPFIYFKRGKLKYNDNINFSKIKNILLIDIEILNWKFFYNNMNNDTFSIVYSFTSDRDNLLSVIESKFTKLSRLAIITNTLNINNKIFINEEQFYTVNHHDCENFNFIVNIIKKFDIKNFDFLTPNTLLYENWKLYYNMLYFETNVYISASIDNTGNLKHGDNWTMEHKSEYIENLYFNNIIQNYSSILLNKNKIRLETEIVKKDENIVLTATLEDIISLNKRIKSQMRIF